MEIEGKGIGGGRLKGRRVIEGEERGIEYVIGMREEAESVNGKVSRLEDSVE